jgi:photosystem II stability/assembly factor-like uncharacterized protein
MLLLGLLASVSLATTTHTVAQEAASESAEEAVEPAQIKPLASKSLLLDATGVDGLMVAVGERGHILTSRDQGLSWQQAEVPVRAAVTGVFFHDENLGWAVGHDALILRTRNGGASWELLDYAPDEQRPFLDIWFADESNGFAIGAYGFFYRTDDGGDTWTDTGLELVDDGSQDEGGADTDYDYGYDDDYAYDYGADMHLNQVTLAASGRLYIAAEAGSIYRSDDGGATWKSLPSPYEGSFFGTVPLDGDSVLLYGLRGHLFRSDDAGESWQELETGTQALLTDGVRLDESTVVIIGLAGAILVSVDGGHSFSLAQQADRLGRVAVVSTDDGHLVTVGEGGVKRLPVSEILGGAR